MCWFVNHVHRCWTYWTCLCFKSLVCGHYAFDHRLLNIHIFKERYMRSCKCHISLSLAAFSRCKMLLICFFHCLIFGAPYLYATDNYIYILIFNTLYVFYLSSSPQNGKPALGSISAWRQATGRPWRSSLLSCLGRGFGWHGQSSCLERNSLEIIKFIFFLDKSFATYACAYLDDLGVAILKTCQSRTQIL